MTSHAKASETPWNEKTWDERFADVEMRAKYWTEGGRNEPDKARAVMNVEQAVNAWKNAAYAAKDAISAATSRAAADAKWREEWLRDHAKEVDDALHRAAVAEKKAAADAEDAARYRWIAKGCETELAKTVDAKLAAERESSHGK